MPAQALPDLADGVRASEDRSLDVAAALAVLSPDHRAAFLLVHVFETPLAEVARIEDVPVGTIKSRASRARAQLRTLFEKEARHERA